MSKTIGDIINNGLTFRIQDSYDHFGFDFFVKDERNFIVGQDNPLDVILAAPAEFRPVEFGQRADPLLHISSNEAKLLMDELWRNGIRPSNGEGNVGQIGATEKHLSDMRKIVSKQIDVDFG